MDSSLGLHFRWKQVRKLIQPFFFLLSYEIWSLDFVSLAENGLFPPFILLGQQYIRKLRYVLHL